MINTNSVILTVMIIGSILSILVHFQAVYAQDAYSKGQRDAIRDFHGLNGHGYDDSCPSGHSSSYCSNYQNGYATQWTVSANDDLLHGGDGGDGTGHTLAEAAGETSQSQAIGGNQVKTSGDNSPVTINQLQSQKDDSPQSNANGENADHNNGGLSSCKAFCVN